MSDDVNSLRTRPGHAVSDDRFSADLAASTGRVLQAARRGAPADLSLAELKSLGDRAAQRHIAARLAETHPYDAVLSEEAPDESDRAAADRVWIIDPLDGTREYAERRADWAVHIALWQRAGAGAMTGAGAGSVAEHGAAGELSVGAVAIPDEDLVLASATVPEIVDADTASSPAGTASSPAGTASFPSPGPLRLAVSRSHRPELVDAVVARLSAAGVVVEPVPMGSAGVKIAAVVRGAADAYLHAGGQYQWDSAAPVAVARAAGLHTSRIDGSPLVYNRAEVFLPDLVVCRPSWSRLLLDSCAAASG